ncbi:uncharacterized protein B0H18DRAFT_1119620 [Fomitopsis serialis]|uniref:uncharacterized protein n=1 Tax=Fomitopsis serialis TaxID=139415 RepID=UPI0020072F6F|nr:uncharacterized protein B0H18DRAFT_1119620 [Neoantrodia serialis]KAH9925195.1 hypothetical protein B0H18DRAFT_1119620 [Neoantrodia serialis]
MADANFDRPTGTTDFVLTVTPREQWRQPIKPTDGLCAADTGDSCNIITTPYANWIPEFPRISEHHIVTFEDGLWGPQEYTRWPQLYNTNSIHHACIPTRGSPWAPGDQVYDGFGYYAWEEDKSCGISAFGFFNADVLGQLSDIATSVIARYEDAERSAQSRDRLAWFGQALVDIRLGTVLSLLLRSAVEHLKTLPTTRLHALVTGRLAHRLILELCGLTIYHNEVAARMADAKSQRYRILPVLGAFVRSVPAAQLLHRLGIPFWLIQPWTRDVIIQKVVEPRRWSQTLNSSPAWPRVPKSWYDPDGTHQDPGKWTQPSVLFVSNLLCSSALPKLHAVARTEEVERDAKRFKGDDGAFTVLPKPHDVRPTTHNSKKRGHKSRGKRSGAKPSEPHPATTFQPPSTDVVELSPNWRTALTGVSPLPFPPPVALEYFLPPPFVIENAKTNKARYLHNFARIWQFCKLRLIDSSIDGAPLRIAEWRHALYGDYNCDAIEERQRKNTKQAIGPQSDRLGNGLALDQGPSNGDAQSASTAGDRKPEWHVERREAVRALFAKGGGLVSYTDTQHAMYRGVEVSLDRAKTDEEYLRLVIWELYEANWRCELRALDSRLVDYSGDAFRKWEREQVVSSVWHTPSQQSAVTTVDVGEPVYCWFAAGQDGWLGRRGNLRAFVDVMSLWPNFPESLRADKDAIATCEKTHVFDDIEVRAIRFYVQSFTEQFHRLPCPPVRLVTPPLP